MNVFYRLKLVEGYEFFKGKGLYIYMSQVRLIDTNKQSVLVRCNSVYLYIFIVKMMLNSDMSEA